MFSELTLILALPPEAPPPPQAGGLIPAHCAYRVGGGPHLFRAPGPVARRGGFLAVDDLGFDGLGEPEPLCREILRECTARGFTGVLLDFAPRPLPVLGQAAGQLEGPLAARGWPLYVPEPYARYVTKGKVLVSSALSGGSLRQRLTDAVERYGRGRVALLVERVARDFYLPSPSGQGEPLSREALAARLAERAPAVFFSHELCANYFTYMSRQDGAHFVLFDDGRSIRRKLQVARSLGVTDAVLPWRQVDDLLEDILA